ncbi:DUF2079 domain-containing protein [Actinomadura flavalba]|uniref:DUF2079 domain-containing protein n=1 Tax=Actinomadura flavalba TaxID=1120938 RepID=UPI0023E44A76|nr:DUF2079 domain-containing protein [Actinomadura flavalba]
MRGVVQFATYRAGTYDLAIFDQAVRGYSRFGAPLSHVKGQWRGPGAQLSVLADHFSPLLAVLAPAYWIHDGPETLIVAQAVLFALAAVPLWVFARRLVGVAGAYAVTVAYLVSWPIAAAVAFSFHEVAFTPLLTALLFERFQAGRRRHALAIVVLLLLVKEDMGLFVAGFGAGTLLARQGRRLGAGLVVGGLAAVWLTARVLIPAFGGTPDRYWYYGGLGPSPGAAAWFGLTRPLDAVAAVATPDAKLWTLLLLLAPLLFLPLRSPYVVAPLALLALRMLATDPDAAGWWGMRFHYNAAVIMGLLCAAVDGCARLRGRSGPAFRTSATVAMAAITVIVAAWSPWRDLANPAWSTPGPRAEAAAGALRLVPDGALVEAANALGPNLSARANVTVWAAKMALMPRRAPWIVADTASVQPHFGSLDAQWGDLARLLRDGYLVVYACDGYLVLTVTVDDGPGRLGDRAG